MEVVWNVLKMVLVIRVTNNTSNLLFEWLIQRTFKMYKDETNLSTRKAGQME